MEGRHRILLVDDDADLLQAYSELLAKLPSGPLIETANTGQRAMTRLEAEPFKMIICDLRMPKMDGLQLLSIVRRKFPFVRTVAMTALPDEQFRSRVYALGVDLFWHKPATEQEINMFLECLESLLGQDQESGFRGMQSKSLVDIIQLECIALSSSVLRINNGKLSGKIWIQDGDVIDAEADELSGEEAFRKILSWSSGSFETLPAEPSRGRTIFKSYSGLLLECAQALDESMDRQANGEAPEVSPLARAAQTEGMEFILALGGDEKPQSRGLENPVLVGKWSQATLERFNSLGEKLQAGPVALVEALGPTRRVTLVAQAEYSFCLGWNARLAADDVRERTRKTLALWGS